MKCITKTKNKGEGVENIKMWSVDAIDPCGDDLESLRWDLDKMLEAVSKPVLYEDRNKLKEYKG